MSTMLEALLSQMGGDDEWPKILPEAAIERLREYAQRYRTPCPFEPGDLVTPRKDAPIRGAGQPHIVLEVRRDADLCFAGEPGTTGFGMRFEMRVAILCGDHIAAHWVEHHGFRAYVEPVGVA